MEIDTNIQEVQAEGDQHDSQLNPDPRCNPDQLIQPVSSLTDFTVRVDPNRSDDDDEDEGIGNGETTSEKDGETPDVELKIDIEQV